MSFENNIKSWVNLDNQIRILNERVRNLREERSKESETILSYVQTENLTNATIQISDGRIKFISSKQTSPLTFTYIKNCLSNCIKNKGDVESIMDYIKNSREIKTISDIKRTYANK